MPTPHAHPDVATACLDIIHHVGRIEITVPRGWLAPRFMNAIRSQLSKLGYEITYATEKRRNRTLLHVTIIGRRDQFADSGNMVTPEEQRNRYERMNEPLT